MRNMLHSFERMMITVDIIRDDKITATVKGLKSKTTDSNRKFFSFYPDTDIRKGDWIQNHLPEERYYVDEVDFITFNENVEQKNAYFISQDEYNNCKQHDSSVVFNIENAANSIIGTQEGAILNNNSFDIDTFAKLVELYGKDDQEMLNELVSTLKTITKNNIPVSKGTLAKFGDVITKYSWVFSGIAKIITAWLGGQ